MRQKLKNTTIAVIAIIMIITQITTITMAQLPVFTAPAYGKSLAGKTVFTDIAQTVNSENILKLRMAGIIQGNAGAKYNPASPLTYQEAAAYLIRALGQDEAAEEKRQALTARQTATDYIADAWAIGYMEEAITQGILTRNDLREMETLTQAEENAIEAQVVTEAKKEWMTIARRDALRAEKIANAKRQKKNMKRAIPRQDLALWITRALELENLSQSDINIIYGYNDWNHIKSRNLAAVETLLQKNILPATSSNTYSPNGSINRGTAADLFNKIIMEYPDIFQIKTGVGRLTKIQQNYNSQITGIQRGLLYTMENFDGTEFDVAIGENDALPVILKNKTLAHTALNIGDTVEYAIKEDKILYAALGIYDFVQGKISYSDKKGTIRIEDNQKNITEVKVGEKTILTSLGNPIREESIIVGQPVKALHKNSILTHLDIMEPVDYYDDVEYIDGIIKYIDDIGKVIKFEDYDGNLRTYGLDDRTIVTINDYYETIDKLHTEQDAVFEINGRVVKNIKAFTAYAPEAPKEYKAVLRVREVDGNDIILTRPEDRQNPMKFKTDTRTSLTYLGYPIKIHNIKVGDLVKINSDKDHRAESIELMAKRQRVEKIYKAKILDILPTEYRLALSDVQSYKYPDWERVNSEKTFALKKDTEIYKDGMTLQLADLSKQKGIEAYIATVNDFGTETIAKITLKSVSEDSVYSGSIGAEWTTNTIKLSGGEKLAFDEGTIIIKDRRLLDISDLTYNKEAFLVKNKLPGGQNFAAIISLENANGFDYRNVVRGYIHDMGEDNFSLESIAYLINNDWEYYYDGEEYYYVSKDTKIFDNVVEKSYITRDTFLASRYWEKKDKENAFAPPNYNAYTIHDPEQYSGDKGPHYEKCKLKSQHMLAYAMINEDGEAIAINIYKRDPNLGKENINFTETYISGEVESINEVFTQLKLADIKKFSNFDSEWKPSSAKETINTSNAMIIKNDRVVSLGDLTLGDKIYAIIDSQAKGIMIFVE